MPDNIEKMGVRAVVENLDGYVRDLKRLTGETDKSGKSLKGAAKETTGFAGAAKAAATGFLGAQLGIQALTTAARFAKTAFIDFEQGIANAGAVAGATKAEMKAMTEGALEIGRSTRFSAVQATAAFEEMAAAGIPVKDILDGGAQAAAALAAAGGVALPLAADVMSTAMAVWGLSTNDAAEAANRLAGAANVSRFAVEDMALAVAQGGGAAAASGVEFGDFTTAIAAIAPSFSSGSDAGTSFKTFLTRLTGETPKALKAMADLGLVTEDGKNQFFDAAGNMKSMGEVAGLLGDAFRPLTEQQRLQNLQVIFGTDAMRAASSLMQVSREEFDKMSRTMRDTDAAEVAARRMDTLGGRIAFMQSTLETMVIDIGIKVGPALKFLVDGITDVIVVFDSLPDSTKNLLLLGGAFLAAAQIAIPAMKSMVGGIKGMIAWMTAAENAARLKMAVGIGIAAAAVLALDLGLKAFTGDGLISTITGAGRRARDLAQRTKELDIAMGELNTTGEKTDFLIKGLAANMAAGVPAIEEFGLSAKFVSEEYRNSEKNIKLYAERLLETTDDVEVLTEASDSLTGVFKEQFDELVDLELRQQAHAEALRDEAHEANLLRLETALAALETKKQADALALENEALVELESPMETFLRQLEDGEDRADKVNDQLDRMIGLFGSLNPQVQANDVIVAGLNEQIGDLEVGMFDARQEMEILDRQIGDNNESIAKIKDSTETLTAAQLLEVEALEASNEALEGQKEAVQETIQPMEDQVVALEDQRAGLENSSQGFLDNAAAIDVFADAIGRVIGPEVMLVLLEQLRELGTEEDVTDALRLVSGALSTLETEGAASAIAGLEAVKGEMDPELWKALAAEIGPVMISEIATGIEDPVERGILQQKMVDLGFGMTQATADEILAEAAAIGPDFLAEVQASLGPIVDAVNAEGVKMGASMGQGVTVGIEAEQAEVRAAAAALATEAMASFAGLIGFSSPAKAFIEMGVGIGDGLALGIQEREPLIQKSMLDTLGAMDRIIQTADLPEKIKDWARMMMTRISTGIQEGDPLIIEQVRDLTGNMEAEFQAGTTAIGEAVSQLPIIVGDAVSELPTIVGDAVSQTADVAAVEGQEVGIALADGIERTLPEVLRSVDLLGFSIVQTLQPISARIAEVAETALDLMSDAFNERAQRIQDEDNLGKLGANIMTSLGEALETGSARAFSSLGTFLADFLFEMEEGLDPEAAGALMGRVMGAMNRIIETGGAEGVNELRAILLEIETLMAEASDTVERSTLSTLERFNLALATKAQEIADEDALGRLGVGIMEDLIKGIEEEAPKAIDSAGERMAELMERIDEKLKPEESAAIMARVMTAMTLVIESEGAEGVEALKLVLSQVNTLMTTGLKDAEALAAAIQVAATGAIVGTAVSSSGGPGSTPSRPTTGAAVSGAGVGGGGGVSGSGTEEFTFEGLRFKFKVNRSTRTIEPSIEAVQKSSPWRQINPDEGSGTGFITNGEVWKNSVTGMVNPGHVFRRRLIEMNEATQKAAQDTSIVDQQSVKGIRGLDPSIGFATGTASVPETGLFQLHAGEMVVPARLAMILRRAINAEGREPGSPFPGGGGGVQSMALPQSLQRESSSDLIEVARALSGPRMLQGADSLGGGPGGGLNIVFDLKGATLTGTLEENRRMMTSIAEDVIADQVTRGAFLGGRRR